MFYCSMQYHIIATILFHTCRPIKASYERIHRAHTTASPHTLPHQAEKMATRSKLSEAEFCFWKKCRGMKMHSHVEQTMLYQLPGSGTTNLALNPKKGNLKMGRTEEN